jgi:thymidine kinase
MPGEMVALIIGNMFSGKSEDEVHRARAIEKYQKRPILCFKPDVDTRTPGKICGRSGEFLPAIEVPHKSPEIIATLLREEEIRAGHRFDVLVFDEVQFYPKNSCFHRLVGQFLEQGRDILAAGLPLNFRGEPFGPTLDITWYARSNTVYRVSYCARCGADAPYPQRLHADGSPSHWDEPEIVIDHGANYEPRCGRCFILPGRPLL